MHTKICMYKMRLISRNLCCQSNLPDFQGQEKIVIRRYSDFVWLHDHLFEKYKGIFIPPLPEKSTVGNNPQNLPFHWPQGALIEY